jgi:hypothetical protein
MAKHQDIASITKSISDTDAPAAAPSFPVEISSMTATPKREIAFIDRGVDDLETLLKGIRPDVEPILLSNDEPAPRDGRRGYARSRYGANGLVATRSQQQFFGSQCLCAGGLPPVNARF